MSATQEFDYVVQGYCRDRVGMQFIKRGDYEVIRAEDSQIVGPSELASMVTAGMKLEMSILVWQGATTKEKCPRCNHINSNAATHHGWVQWKVHLNVNAR
jgi:hypothetical protein